ncbi:SPOR domain-containing protein [Maribius pontilimi]|uniref:SPOR domain-containing protein n=1 Tax=Palleronia pontilimi TaxID=1964209 RepID=A0A934MFX3_9RHOB|nr:SPOR domain-containing protein [Palleronia pontilimi]MBJ3761854.1 SPOR domain-containing protein [Palleronia pontilimi]
MAEIDYMEEYGGHSSTGSGLDVSRWVNLSGALVSLALIGGLSVWGYKLLVRDVTGVPVVQAMEGAFRVAPDDPGGMRAPHQGLAVNEIAALGEASGPVDEVRLAPPTVGLTDEDRAAAVLELLAAEDSEEVPVPSMPAMAEPIQPEPVALSSDIDEIELENQVPDGALATDAAVAEALNMPEDFGAEDESERVAQIGAVSPRPLPRPARAAAVVATQPTGIPEAMPVAAVAGEVDVASLAQGTRLVQLGAFASGDVARAEWDKIAARFPDYFDGKRRVVQRAESGGKTFFRLRAEGFTDLADTRRFCTALVAGQADCIPVELR